MQSKGEILALGIIYHSTQVPMIKEFFVTYFKEYK